MAETINEEWVKKTDENMDEYTKFSNALFEYTAFLMKKRGLPGPKVVEMLVPMVRVTIAQVIALQE